MLKPSVGLILLMSSPFNFLRIVVFPALSSPLWRSAAASVSVVDSNVQEQQAHLFLLLPVLANDRQQTHVLYRLFVAWSRNISREYGGGW